MDKVREEKIGRWAYAIKTKKELVQKQLWQRISNQRGKTEPVFLVGCGRSGTNMIVQRLSRSYSLDLYNEDHPDVFINWRLKSLWAIKKALKKSYARRILFKPILDTHRICQLLYKFPSAKALFAFRHFSGVVQSSIKRFGPNNRIGHVNSWIKDDFSEFKTAPPPEETKSFIRSLWKPSLNYESGAALYWLFYNRLYFDLHLDREPRVSLVRYESVVLNPSKEFQEICMFLDLPFHPRMVEGIYTKSINQNPFPTMDEDILNACNQLWNQMCLAVGINHSDPSNLTE
jgi:hypothetical protein